MTELARIGGTVPAVCDSAHNQPACALEWCIDAGLRAACLLDEDGERTIKTL